MHVPRAYLRSGQHASPEQATGRSADGLPLSPSGPGAGSLADRPWRQRAIARSTASCSSGESATDAVPRSRSFT